MRAMIGRRQKELAGQDPQIDRIHVFRADAQFAVLASRARREDVVVALAELIDHAGAGGVDVREFAFKHEGADDEVVVRMHVVAAAGAMKRFVAEHADRTEAGTSALIVMKIETRFAGDEAVRSPAT